jgi:hypothetical protein
LIFKYLLFNKLRAVVVHTFAALWDVGTSPIIDARVADWEEF